MTAGLCTPTAVPPASPARLRFLALAGDPMLQPNTLPRRPMGTQD